MRNNQCFHLSHICSLAHLALCQSECVIISHKASFGSYGLQGMESLLDISKCESFINEVNNLQVLSMKSSSNLTCGLVQKCLKINPGHLKLSAENLNVS